MSLDCPNDFIFGKVMRNPALCKELLQLILPELDIDHIEYPESQKTFQADTGFERHTGGCVRQGRCEQNL